jgi:YfiH family protein
MHPLVLRSERLTQAGFVHGFSTRWASPGGAEGPSPSGDEHLRGFLAALGREVSSAVRVKQVHGAAVLEAAVPDWGAEADAVVLGPGDAAVTPVIRTADCVPILLANPSTGRVGAVHAGWRGVEKRILAAAVRAMASPANRLVAAIGPCLCAACFEVGEEVVAALVPVSGEAVVDRSRGPKPHVDLRLAVRLQLRAIGLDDAHVEDVPGCTRCEPERFFSYRRDGANAGRQMAVIVARAAVD